MALALEASAAACPSQASCDRTIRSILLQLERDVVSFRFSPQFAIIRGLTVRARIVADTASSTRGRTVRRLGRGGRGRRGLGRTA